MGSVPNVFFATSGRPPSGHPELLQLGRLHCRGQQSPRCFDCPELFVPLFGSPTSTLLGTNGLQADAQHAALINGIASHVHDYDDTHLETIIHPTGPVAAALLSFAQSLDRPVSGQDFLAALAAGIELECKAGLAVWPSHYDVGWYVC